MIFSKKMIRLGGTDEYVLVGDVLNFERTDPFTLTFLFATTTSGLGMLVTKLEPTAPNTGYEVYYDAASDRLLVNIISDVTTSRISVSSVNNSFEPDGVLRHVAIVYDGSSTAAGVKFYRNAEEVAKNAPTHDTLTTSIITAVPLQFGARSDVANLFIGDMDEIGIYKAALSQAQIVEIYRDLDIGPRDLRLLSTAADLVGYWTCGDGDTFPNLRDRQVATPAANTGASVKDRSVNSNDGTPVAMEVADFRAVILASETMPDLSGNGNHGTPTNMEDGDFTTDVPAPGFSWYSMTLDGANEYVQIGDVAPYKFDVGDALSIEIWFKTSSSTAQVMVGKINFADAAAPGYSLEIASDGTVLFEFIDDLTVPQRVVVVEAGSVDRADGAWHHAIVAKGTTEAGSDTSLYLDGEDVTSLSIDTFVSNGGTSFDNALPLQIGGANGQFTWNGQLDEAVIYDKKLSLAEAKEHFAKGRPVDKRTLSTKSSIIGYWGCGDAGPGGVLRNVAHLDGVAEYIDYGDQPEFQFARTDPFSLGYLSKFPVGNAFEQVMSKLQLSGVRGYAVHHASTIVGLDLINESATPLQATKRGDYPDDGCWHRVICTWDGDALGGAAGINVYVDGVLAPNQSILFDTLASLTIANNAPLRVGATGWASAFTEGAVCGAFVVDRELTAAEVLRDYNGSLPIDLTLDAIEPNLVGYWDLGAAANTGVMTNMEAGDLADTEFNTASASAGHPATSPAHPQPRQANPLGLSLHTSGMQSQPIQVAPQGALLDADSGLIFFGDPKEVISPPAGIVHGIRGVGQGLSYKDIGAPAETVGGGGGIELGPGEAVYITKYNMRAEADPGPGYVSWQVTGSADFAGSFAPSAILPGTAVVVGEEFEEVA